MLTGIYILLGIIAVVFGYVGYEVHKVLKTDFGLSDITELDE